MRKAKIRFGQLNNIFISHLHGDHVFGIFGLLSTFNLLGRKSTLHLYGHSDLKKIIDFYHDQFAPDNLFQIELHFVSQRKMQSIYEDKSVEVYAFPLKHRIPTFGYLFREKKRMPNVQKEAIKKYGLTIKQILDIKNGLDVTDGSGIIIPKQNLIEQPFCPRSYAFCSDTASYDRIIPWIKDVSLLYHEATFIDRDRALAKKTGHSTALQAAKTAQKAGVDQLLIGHFSSRYKDQSILVEEARKIFPETFLAEELQKYSVPTVREKLVQ